MPHSLVEPAGSRLIASLTTNPTHQEWLEQALQLALHNRQQGGRPFAALLVQGNQLVTSAVNAMHQDGDPTRHAELEALRQASQVGPLAGAIVYASGHPCPMCLSALVMNGIAAVYYAFDNEDAAPFGFDSTAAYHKLGLPLAPPPLPLIKLPSPLAAAELYGAPDHA
ncbi:TPA: nucleoside deaminase [Aeromonas dhakensis]|uniref:nucleoside deaminase n=1 Tax=Aeromonas dhakensis TaxID=196024 RepID=UPI000F44C9AC|nr:nucleoside deaminase [Aeromonas dhakensis]MCJ2369054.1 nucleoside deaminase [Aeromonas dhakensis]HDX8345295.1 nucleoside deaminase [Aeromonas dhakensis]HDX9010241.1 nucleoside deaminase [Aeromonas dhakensis]